MAIPILYEPNSAILGKAAHIYRQLRRTVPITRADLKNYVKVFLGINVPDKKICPEHNAPMDYLWHSFTSDRISSHEDTNAQRNQIYKEKTSSLGAFVAPPRF